ncbi:MAG: hypothetical protein ACI4TL_00960, partial [Candidatus Cryptobacteroides sp.]
MKTCWSSYGLSFISICCITPLALYIIGVLNKLIFTQQWEGPGIAFRAFVFAVAVVVLCISMPTRCYGRITKKNFGSFYLSLPASTLEKFLSMILICVVICPLIGMGAYLAIDGLICLIDKSCGESILKLISDAYEIISKFLIARIPELETDSEMANSIISAIKQLCNPLLYLDDFAGCILPFLLGALYFKKNKVVKTILCLIGLSIILSFAFAPLTNNLDIFDQGFFTLIADKISLIDTISDSVTNIALL